MWTTKKKPLCVEGQADNKEIKMSSTALERIDDCLRGSEKAKDKPTKSKGVGWYDWCVMM